MTASDPGISAFTLYYMDHPFWRAECIRLAVHIYLAKGKQLPFEYKDARVNGRALRESGKPVFGQMPVAGVVFAADDSKQEHILAEVQAICSFVGKQIGFYPTANPWEMAKMDEAFGGLTSATDLISSTMGIQPPERKIQVRQSICDLEEGRLTQFVGGLETLLQKANGTATNQVVFVPSFGLSIVDLAAWRFVGWVSSGILDGIPTKWVQESFPLLWQVHRQVDSMPETQSWKGKHSKFYSNS
ncbi:unnamed protein product [Amoebophrya sp. A120]|nr:unnamed protein product [Amoebophrya sp. A120]|eukprot:GSA120T00005157001.1